MGEPAQRGLQPADDNGAVGIGLPRLSAVDDDRPVGPRPRLAAGGIGVVAAFLLGGGVVGHHGVDVAPADEEAQGGPPEAGEIRRASRLRQDAHPPAAGLQHPGQDGDAEGGVVDISVPRDQHHVRAVPAPVQHLLFGDRQKRHSVRPFCYRVTGCSQQYLSGYFPCTVRYLYYLYINSVTPVTKRKNPSIHAGYRGVTRLLPDGSRLHFFRESAQVSGRISPIFCQ